MSINGNLNTMELSEVLQWLSNGAKTGTLALTKAGVRKKIYFRKGAVIATASSDPQEYLGHFLVGRGHIDELVLAQAMSMQTESNMLLGKILVTIGAISEAVLLEMLKLKSEETICEIFTWSEGDFRFLADELPGSSMVPLDINLNAVILEGVKRADEWQHLASEIPSTQAVAVSTGPLEPPPGDAAAAQILAAVNDDRTLEEIVLHAHSSEYHVRRVILDHVENGRIKLVRPRSLPTNGSAAPSNEPASAPTELLTAAQTLLENQEYGAAMRHFRAALSLDPGDKALLGEVASAEADIRKVIEQEGIRQDAVPRLTRELDELATVDLKPEEGFLLSRIDGNYDVSTLVKISPMPALDALLVLRNLSRAGHVKLEP